jgi:Glycosyl hydrolases family 39
MKKNAMYSKMKFGSINNCIAILGFLSLTLGNLVHAEVTRDTPGSIPLSFFGMHIHRADTTTRWPKSPIGSWRLWDAYVAWPNLEPDRGKWDFRRLDSFVLKAERAGASLLLPLGLSPRWASARPDEKASYQPGNAAEPLRIEDWRNYVRTVASRYRGKIYDYEIWNEANLKGFYSGSLDTLIALTREAYLILKEVDPANRLVSPAFVGGDQAIAPWFELFLQKGGGRYVDIIGYHFYVPKGPPEMMIPLINQAHDAMRRAGVLDKLLWSTEAGWLILNREQEFKPDSYDKTWVVLDEDQASAYLARAFIIAWAYGLQRYYWYAWDNGLMGFIEPISKREKKLVSTYDTVVRWLEGAQLDSCTEQARVWHCAIHRSDGSRGIIVWKESGGSSAFAIPLDWKIAQVEALDGSREDLLPIGRANIPISEQPRLLLQATAVKGR